jgi:hypothetical protein
MTRFDDRYRAASAGCRFGYRRRADPVACIAIARSGSAVSAASDVSKLQVYAAILIGDAMGRNPSLKEALVDPRSKPKL